MTGISLFRTAASKHLLRARGLRAAAFALLIATACVSNVPSDAVLEMKTNADNVLGWVSVSADVWEELALEGCDRAVWDESDARAFADEVAEENRWENRDGVERLAEVIWINMTVACRDDMPPGATPP